jgi:hypothetical protein
MHKMFYVGRLFGVGLHLTYVDAQEGFERGRKVRAAHEVHEEIHMKSDGPLILAVLSLVAGLTIIVKYGVGTGGFNAAYPVSGASLQMSISTAGPAAIGGMALLALGLLLMLWALLCAIVGQFVGFGTERGRAERLERRERKQLEREERQLERDERLSVLPKG